MRGSWIVVLGVVALAGGSAAAAPLKAHNGSTVRLAVEGRHETGVGLRPHAGGWRLEVAVTPADSVYALDVTAGALGAKWSVPVRDGGLFFDQAQFIAGHAYRVYVRRGTEMRGEALVYLYPPRASARQKVTFDEDEAAGGDDGELATIKKPSL